MSRRFSIALFIAVAVGVLVPFVVLGLWSASAKWFYPSLIPDEFGMRAWTYVFGAAGGQILPALGWTVAVALLTAFLSVLVGAPAGRVLGLYRFRGKDVLSIVFMLPVIVPPLSVAMGLHLWFIRLGLAETFLGVVLVHLTFCVPYATFVMWGAFSNYNPDFEDQARSLGASRLSVALRVTLPMTLPAVAVAGLFSFLLSWSQYLSTLIIGGGRIQTLPIMLFALMGSGDRPVAAAVSIVFVAPATLALLFSARYIGRKTLAGVW